LVEMRAEVARLEERVEAMAREDFSQRFDTVPHTREHERRGY